MPEAVVVAASLPTAGTVPHTDDESPPDTIQSNPTRLKCSTVLGLLRQSASPFVEHVSEKNGFSL